MIATQGLALLVWSPDLARGDLMVTPFMMAQAARALDTPVTMLFSAQSVNWLLLENSDALIGFGNARWPVARHLAASRDMGVEIRACSQALSACGASLMDLHPAVGGVEGMVSFVEQGQQPGWQMLVF